ncbi:MAG TPA: DUF6600 domain-containing protein [Steroidobacteraceae bacterium]|nr:DUF6600 domain-containing protein [Steroidobacteraceae bacterium]
MSHTAFRAIATASLCLMFGLAHGQENAPYDADPPDRAARLSFLQGDVSLQPAGEEEWADAIVNRPLTTGDKLWTDQGARAEIYVGQAAVRLGSNTGFSFLNVDDDTIQMRMTAGVINVHVRDLDSNDQIEIDTPNLALSLLRPGNYRVEVNDENDTTVVKVSEGEAEASDGSQSEVVHAQQAATFRGNQQLAAQFGSLGAPDEFDSWSLERDRRDEQAASSRTAQYVDPDVTGYEDLDANGTWSSDAEYGNVWTPTRVAVDWSPYRDGRWVWVAPWGWTWIDDAPWGYAPFHYGRWAHVRDRWCWVPGPRHVRAVYAPALVGWVGTPGASISISVGGGGGVAWFPLGPREVYVPARRFSPRYVERVNVTNTIVNRVIITNVYNNRAGNVTYRNRAVPGAVTSVTRTTFTSAQRIGDRRVRIDEREISRTGSTAMAPQIQPGRESRLGASEARRNVRVPPATVVSRQVIVKRSPPPSGAHFARNVGQPDARHEPADRQNRAPDRTDRSDTVIRTRPDNGRNADARPDVNRDAAQPAPSDRARDARNPSNMDRRHDDRPPRVNQPRVSQPADSQPSANQSNADQSRVEDSARQNPQPRAIPRTPAVRPQVDRPQVDRPQVREQPEREQPAHQQQEARQAELQQRQQREQQQQQQRAATQRADADQQQRQRPVERPNVERPNVERPNVERPSRPEPQRPAENKPQQPQQQQPKDHDRKRSQDDSQR